MEQLLTFTVQDERYGIDIKDVQEIIESPQLHYVPRAPENCLGATNFHGSIVTVIDVPKSLGFDPGTKDHRVVVLSAEFNHLALSVNNLENIIRLDVDSVIPIQDDGDRSYIREVLSLEDDVVNILDLRRLVADVENIFDQAGG